MLDHLHLDKVHLLGASLGGFLAQKFAELTFKSPRVQSLVLCNAFADTNVFQQRMASSVCVCIVWWCDGWLCVDVWWVVVRFWALPAFVLKRMILSNLPNYEVDSSIADSIDFLVDKVRNMPDRKSKTDRQTDR